MTRSVGETVPTRERWERGRWQTTFAFLFCLLPSTRQVCYSNKQNPAVYVINQYSGRANIQ